MSAAPSPSYLSLPHSRRLTLRAPPPPPSFLTTTTTTTTHRVRTLIENCVRKRERGMFVIIGDKARDQVVNLHNMLSRTVVKVSSRSTRVASTRVAPIP